MSDHNHQLENKNLTGNELDVTEQPCPQRRRLLTLLGVGIVTAYVAPTLFSVGAAEARGWQGDRKKRGSYKRGSYSRGSYSRASGYDGRRRSRSRIRAYSEDPVLILEDVILGPPRR